jgi:stage V sporulation protein G
MEIILKYWYNYDNLNILVVTTKGGNTAMNITDIRIKLIDKEDTRMKAIVSLTIDNSFVIHDIKVINGEKGLFIAMPSKKDNDGEYKDIAHPINTATRNLIHNAIINRYEEVLKDM